MKVSKEKHIMKLLKNLKPLFIPYVALCMIFVSACESNKRGGL